GRKTPMQRHFRVECGVQQCRKAPHSLKIVRLGYRQCQNAAIVNQEHIILAHIVAKCRQWQRAVTNPGDKRVFEDPFTHCCGLLTQLLGKTHAPSLCHCVGRGFASALPHASARSLTRPLPCALPDPVALSRAPRYRAVVSQSVHYLGTKVWG